MKQVLLLVLFLVLSCKNGTSDTKEIASKSDLETSIVADEEHSDVDLEIYDYDGLKPHINVKDDKIHIVNFWATWCAPCIKELPYFESVREKYKNNVEVLLVSLDFPSKYDLALIPFIKEQNIKSRVVALDDTDQNRWIPAINKNWSGAIPATIIYKGKKRQFYEKSFTQEELETELQQFLKK